MKRTAKYIAACELTRVRGDNARVYAAVGRAGYAWDSAAGWYVVDERATGRVKVRLEGTFKDVVAFAAKLGLDLEPAPGRKGGWLAYGSTKSGATPVRKPPVRRAKANAKRAPRRPEVTEVKPRRANAKRSPRRPEVTEVKPRRAKATPRVQPRLSAKPRPRTDVMADVVAGLLDEALAGEAQHAPPPARGRRPVAPIGFAAEAFAGNRIRKEMRAAADDENFELAAELRERAKLKPGRRRRSS